MHYMQTSKNSSRLVLVLKCLMAIGRFRFKKYFGIYYPMKPTSQTLQKDHAIIAAVPSMLRLLLLRQAKNLIWALILMTLAKKLTAIITVFLKLRRKIDRS